MKYEPVRDKGKNITLHFDRYRQCIKILTNCSTLTSLFKKKKERKEEKKDKSIRYKIFYASILLTHVKLHDDCRNANATREQGKIIEIGEDCAATPAICPATATMGNEWLLHVQQFGFPSREQPS